MSGPGVGLVVALLKAVGRLALPAEAQISHLCDRGLWPSIDEFALELHEGAVLVPQFVANGWLAPRDAAAITAIDEMLDRMSRSGNQELWTLDALTEAHEWEAVRCRAREILAT